MSKGRNFWFDERLLTLERLLSEKRTVEFIARYFDRSPEAIRMAIHRNLKRPQGNISNSSLSGFP